MRTLIHDGTTYVGVTSAMKLVKELLGEEPESYGPPALAKIHALEGQACHQACLNWLACHAGWVSSYRPPAWEPAKHPDERQWTNVIANALEGFMEFVEGYQVEPIGIEMEILSKPLGLVGHMDLMCFLQWKKHRMKAIVDLKFVAKILESHRLQVRTYHSICKANLGLIFHGDRGLGTWRIEPVDLTTGLADVSAVSMAARLFAWGEAKRGQG